MAKLKIDNETRKMLDSLQKDHEELGYIRRALARCRCGWVEICIDVFEEGNFFFKTSRKTFGDIKKIEGKYQIELG